MAITGEYQRLVLDDIRKTAGLTRPRKAGLLERLLVRRMRLDHLHPNPDDEFSDPKIGPNDQIVSDYVQNISNDLKYGRLKAVLDEPLIIEGRRPRRYQYMLLNGHHRWMAANRIGIQRVKVRIVNMTREEDVLKTMDRSQNTCCAAFDLDEVILANTQDVPRESHHGHPLSGLFSKQIRQGVPALMTELRQMGFDIWVYSGGYLSANYVRMLFSVYHIPVDGIVIGLKGRGSGLKEHFADKYTVSLHADSKGLTCVNTRTRTYETAVLEKAADEWAPEVIAAVRAFREVQEKG